MSGEGANVANFKYRYKAKGAKAFDEISVDVREVTIGSQTNAFVPLPEDPLAKAIHCRITAVPNGSAFDYQLKDEGSSSGTYINGKPVGEIAVLPAECTLIVGATRIDVKISATGCDLTIDEKSSTFYFDPQTDYVRWAEREVGFGRFRPVSFMNWWAVLIAILVTIVCFLPFTTDWVMDPGPKIRPEKVVKRNGITGGVKNSDYHSRTFHVAALGSAYEKMLNDPKLFPNAGDRDCNACHDPFGSTPDSKCQKCHPEIMPGERGEGQHPFGPHDKRWQGHECRTCHVEHRSAESDWSLIAKKSQDTCKDCHNPVPTDVKFPKATVPERSQKVGYFTFSHKDHANKAEKVGCVDCHVIDRSIAKSAETPREFTALAYESCMKCHDATKADHEKKPKDAAKLFSLAWHGAEGANGDKCLQCHQTKNDDDLKMVDHQKTGLLFSYSTKSHTDEADTFKKAHAGGTTKLCSDCHKNQKEFGGGADRKLEQLTHFSHVAAMDPSKGKLASLIGSKTETGRGTCYTCHKSIAESDHLPTPAERGATAQNLQPVKDVLPKMLMEANCGDCHRSANMTVSTTPQAPEKRTHFPHDKHLDPTKIKNGCYECHEFSPFTPDVVNPKTPENVRDCSKCHSEHKEIAGNACQKCHKSPDPADRKTWDKSYWNDDGKDEKYGDHRVTLKRPADLQFLHMSRGHVNLFNDKKCEDCHSPTTWDATTLLDVPVPVDGDPACRKCHVEKMERFHWR